jgi:hypothetical protein
LVCYAGNKTESGTHKDLRAILFVCAGLVLLVPDQAQANRIYKSVDAEGNVTYSSSPPEDARRVEKMDISKSFQPDSSVSKNSTYDEIKAAADELEKDRKQRETQRENARIKQEQQEASKQAQQPIVEHRYYYPIVPLYHHHHHRPRPSRRAHHPPQTRPPKPKGYQYKPVLTLDAG